MLIYKSVLEGTGQPAFESSACDVQVLQPIHPASLAISTKKNGSILAGEKNLFLPILVPRLLVNTIHTPHAEGTWGWPNACQPCCPCTTLHATEAAILSIIS